MRWVEKKDGSWALRGRVSGREVEIDSASRFSDGSWRYGLIPFWIYEELPRYRKGRNPIYPKILIGEARSLEEAKEGTEELIWQVGGFEG